MDRRLPGGRSVAASALVLIAPGGPAFRNCARANRSARRRAARRACRIPDGTAQRPGRPCSPRRTDDATQAGPIPFFGIQTWVALPKDHEGRPAGFAHAPAAALPVLKGEGKTVRLILGTARGGTAPVATPSGMFHAGAVLAPGAAIPLPDDHENRGVHVVEGAVGVVGEVFEAGRMMVFRPFEKVSLKARGLGARVMLPGGDTHEGPRYIRWTFVASSQARIEAAKARGRLAVGALPPAARGRCRVHPAPRTPGATRPVIGA
jgi:hypothetical protein